MLQSSVISVSFFRQSGRACYSSFNVYLTALSVETKAAGETCTSFLYR